MSGLADLTEVRLPRRLVTAAVVPLREIGRRGFEGLALWAGVKSEDVFQVTDVIVPAQRGVRTRRGVSVCVPPDELHRINVWLYENRRVLVAQLHTHPTEAYHSDLDDELPIATTVGCLSLVLPNFARAPFALETTAVYRLNVAACWEKLSAEAAKQLIRLTD